MTSTTALVVTQQNKGTEIAVTKGKFEKHGAYSFTQTPIAACGSTVMLQFHGRKDYNKQRLCYHYTSAYSQAIYIIKITPDRFMDGWMDGWME